MRTAYSCNDSVSHAFIYIIFFSYSSYEIFNMVNLIIAVYKSKGIVHLFLFNQEVSIVILSITG